MQRAEISESKAHQDLEASPILARALRLISSPFALNCASEHLTRFQGGSVGSPHYLPIANEHGARAGDDVERCCHTRMLIPANRKVERTRKNSLCGKPFIHRNRGNYHGIREVRIDPESFTDS
jgi:hypothetical protein